MEKEKQENIRRRKIFNQHRSRESKEGKYLEKENIWSVEENKIGEGKGGKYLIWENIVAEGGYENESFTMDPKRLGKNWTDQSRRRKHQKYTVQKYLFSDPRPNKQVY